jgi:tRNA pseudouridine38-40 synthase
VTRWLLRFGYDGRGFSGWARQPGQRTVEGEIRRGLRHFGIVPAGESGSVAVASRTDRGVSARGNALVLASELGGEAILRAMNGISPEIYFTAAAPVPHEFRVRHSLGRTYRYFDATPVHSPRARAAAIRRLRGRIDVRSFGRGIAPGEPCWRTIDSFESRPIPGGTVLEVRAPSFVWGMVRKMVAAIREVDAGRISIDRLGSAVEGRSRLMLPLAEAEPLLLWQVEYPFPWAFEWTGPNRHQVRHGIAQRDALWARQQVLEELDGRGAALLTASARDTASRAPRRP